MPFTAPEEEVVTSPIGRFIPADVQADRDRQANVLRASEGSPSIEEDDARMRAGGVKKGIGAPGLVNVPKEGGFVTPDSDKIKNSFTTPDSDKLGAESKGPLSKASDLLEYPFDIARFGMKGLAGMAGQVAGPLAGGAEVAKSAITGDFSHTQEDALAANARATSMLSDRPEFQPKTPVGHWLEDKFNQVIQAFKDDGVEAARNAADLMNLSPDNKFRAASHAAAIVGPDIAMTIFGFKGLTAKPGVKPGGTTPLPEIPGAEASPPVTPPAPEGTIPYVKPEMPPEPPPAVVQPSIRGSVPYSESEGIQVGTSPGAAPEPRLGATESIPYDPTVEAQQGEAATPLSARTAGVDAPHQLGLPLVERGEERPGQMTDLTLKDDPEYQFRQAQKDLFEEPIDKATAKPGFMRDALEAKAVREFEQRKAENTESPRTVEASVPPDEVPGPGYLGGTGKKGFGQGGAVDWFDRINKMKEEGRTFDETPKVYNLGDAVRLMSGKSGVVIARTDTGYQIRIHPRDGGGFDFVPTEGIANRSLVGGVGKAGFKQGGAFNFLDMFLKKEAKEPEKTIEVFGNPLKSTADYIKENQLPTDDVKSQLGLSTGSFRSTTPYIANIKSGAAKLMVHFENALHTAMSLEHSLNYVMNPVYHTFSKYYGMGLFSKVKVDQFRTDLKLALDWEKNPESWGGGEGHWYPTGPEMVKLGMNPKSAAVWRGIFDNMEQQWAILEQTATINGREVPPRIPGYLPHIWKGPYSVLMERERSDGSIANVGEYNYYSLKEARETEKIIINQIKTRADGQGINTRVEKPNPLGSGAQEMLDGIMRAKDRMEGVAGLEALTKGIYEGLAKGIVTSVLDRSNPAKIGHLLQRVLDADPVTGLKHSGIKDAIKSFQQMNEAVNAWHARSKLVNETVFPLDAAGFWDASPLGKDTAQRYLENYFKVPKVIWKALDTHVKAILIDHGLDPNMAHAAAAKMNQGFAWYYLGANPSFYIANSFQSLISMPALMMIKAFGELHGEKTGSITRALVSKEYTNIAMLDPKNPLVKYASENGHIDPVGADLMNIHDPVNMGIERRTRMNAFNLGYSYAKQFMSDADALRMGGKFADLVSVPYSKQLGTPALLAQLPVVGSVLSMFMTYQLHQLGLLKQQFEVVKQSSYTGNPKALAYSMGSMLGLQAMNISLFGLGGAALVQNWDQIVKAVNTIFKTDFKTSKELGRDLNQLAQEHGVNLHHVLEHGAISEGIGYDISSSGSGPGPQLPDAVAEGVAQLIAGAVLTGRFFTNVPPTQKEKWEWAKTLPKSVQGMAEYAIKEDHFSDVVAKAMGEKKDYSVDPKDINDPGDYERTQRDVMVRLLTGLKSVGETSTNTTNALFNIGEANIKNLSSYQIQWLKENLTKWGPREDKILLDLALTTGANPRDTITSLIDYFKNNRLSTEEKLALKIHAGELEGIFRYQRFMNQKKKEN